VVDALNINLEHSIEVRSGSSIHPSNTGDARIIDEYVDALTRQHLAEDAVNLSLVRHVAGMPLDCSPSLDNPLCGLIRAVQSPIDAVDNSTRACERGGNRKTDSARASRNNSRAAVKPKLPRFFCY
jgi:hypothetical protein